jgi:hypothetical protein
VVMRAIASAGNSVNHIAPSGPATISVGPVFGVGRGYSSMSTARPLLADAESANPVVAKPVLRRR